MSKQPLKPTPPGPTQMVTVYGMVRREGSWALLKASVPADSCEVVYGPDFLPVTLAHADKMFREEGKIG